MLLSRRENTRYLRLTPLKNKPQAIDSKVRSQIYGHGRGWSSPESIFRCRSTAAVESALRRMRKKGPFACSRGACTTTGETFGARHRGASADAVRARVVGRDAIRLQPRARMRERAWSFRAGAVRIVFLTDGPSRRVKLGKQKSSSSKPRRETWLPPAARAAR